MKVYAFPGQGSQKKGMGQELFDKYTDLVNQASELLSYDVKTLCLEDKDNLLGQTIYTQPMLFLVNHLHYLDKLENDTDADIFIGHSLGEYNALVAAGAFDFLAGLKLVKYRGQVMSEASGSMAAIIGISGNEIADIISKNNLSIDVANYNSHSQTVISGTKEDIVKAEQLFLDNNAKKYVILNVSGAFHSRYMKEASDKFFKFAQEIEFLKLKKVVIANITARQYSTDILSCLTKQIYSSVKWVESIEYLLDKYPDMKFEEVGVGKVLSSLYRQITR